MNRLFGKKSKKSPNPSSKRISLGVSPNVAAGPLRSREELDIGPGGEQTHFYRDLAVDWPDSMVALGGRGSRSSRIIFQDKNGEDKELPAPEVSTSCVVVSGTEHRSDPTRKSAIDAGEEEGGGRLAETSKVSERDDKNTTLRAATILSDVPKEVAHQSGPLGPLKAVLKTIATVHADHQETIGIGNKIGVPLSRVVALEERFNLRPDDVEELRRRDKLICKFGLIEGQLRSLSERTKSGQLAEHAQHNEGVYELLEDLREITSDYQMVQQMAIHGEGRKSMEAEYRHGDRKGCLKGTRGAVLDSIEVWARDFDKPPVYWLNGLAGTGKSTIAQTIAERIFADGQLGASFFCSRDFEDRRNLKFIFPTIAVQLARNYAEFRSIFVPPVEPDPGIAYESLYNQMDKLIFRPLKKSNISTVIVIDALDECKDKEPASAILSVLSQFVSYIPRVKFVITGRPEPRIREGFHLPLLAKETDVFVLHEIELDQTSAHSLLVLQEDIDHPVRPFHKSFPDFIIDPTRCVNQRFHISPPSHHWELLAGCLELMNQMLEKNMCHLPDAVANCEVGDLHGRSERHLDPALRYACKSWHKHLTDEHIVRTPAITFALRRFLEKKFLFWLEVLSVLDATREAADALDVTAKLLEASPTLDLVNDCFRFVMGFFEAISTSSAHIYHSALPLCPRQSMKFLDAVTLERITTLDFPLDKLRRTQQLAFSPNARLLTRFGATPEKIISWDLQTGGLVSAITQEQPESLMDYRSATYSARGTMVAVLLRSEITFGTISIYNVRFGTHTHSHSVDEWALGDIWTHGECLRFATMKSRFITTWEVGFTSPHAPTRVESLPIPDHFDPSREYRFHSTSSRLAFTTEESVCVWDARDSKFLLKSTDARRNSVMSMLFYGRFFACGIGGLGIYLWKESAAGYTLHRRLMFDIGHLELLISPNGESIITFTVTWMRGRTITVVDLKSGIPRLTIDADMEVHGLGVAGYAIVVVGERKFVTWSLPAGNDVPNSKADAGDSVLTRTFNRPLFPTYTPRPTTSVSSDLRRVAMMEWGK
ncbi:hypothetical protein BDM02DRAFT_3263813, partial [Thelephora ganbajun]